MALTTKQITGLRAVLSQSTAYGGISVSDMASWICARNHNSAVNRALTLNLLQIIQGAATFDSDRPKIGTMNQNIWDVLYSLLQPFQRLGSGEEQAKVGFTVASVSGVKYYVDSHQAANTVYLLNPDYLKLYVHRKRNMTYRKIVELETQDASVGQMFWAGNLVCQGRRFQAILEDIEVAS